MKSCFDVSIKVKCAKSLGDLKEMLNRVIEVVEALDFKKAELYPTIESVDFGLETEYDNKEELLNALSILAREAEYVVDLTLILHL